MRMLSTGLLVVTFVLLLTGFSTREAVTIQPEKPTADSTIDQLFKNPPRRYGIRCWWWWLNGNVTKAAITSDLEEMKAKGFSGACIFDAGGYDQHGNGPVPEGPMFGSPAWRDLYLHALREADRLGLVLSMSIQSGWNLGGPDVSPEEATKHLTWSETTVKGPVKLRQPLTQPPTKDKYYREVAVLAFPAKPATNRPPIRDLAEKTASKEVGAWGIIPDTRNLLIDVPATPGEEDVTLKGVQNLTSRLNAQGVLEWDVPAGEWVVMRFGYTPTDAEVSTSSGKWKGRVIDYMSEKAFNRYWDTNVEPLLQAAGPLAGKSLRYLQTDSWELGGINWTDRFAEEFRNRRGYDIWPYLPVVAGKIVENREVSNRFLADFRKTISDCIAQHHYGVFAERAKRHGMGIQPESAGPHAGPFDGLKNYGFSEIMMSEFWSPSPHRPTPEKRFFVKQAASAAHIYNRPLVGAESFTTIGPHWNDVIWSSMKSSFDHEICSGLNLVYLHTFTSSPSEMGLPGQEYFAGTHFNPNVTWWNWSGAFIQYMTRCQFLMQQGMFVADALYYNGDHVPNLTGLKESDPAKVLPGYDYDVINEERLAVLKVQNGRIMLPHGLSYRVLVLPDHRVLSLVAMKKVNELVQAGATVIGFKPESTASLAGSPQADTELSQLATALWGNEKTPSGQRKVGQGRIIWGQTAREVLQADGLKPDFVAESVRAGQAFNYIHQTLPEMDYYFVSNQNQAAAKATCSFRITGKQPELWNPMTGEIREVSAFRQENEQTIIPLEFDPYGSVFVVFRKPIPAAKNGAATGNFDTYSTLTTLKGPWEVQFDPKWGGPASVPFDSLVSWTQRPEEGIRYYSGKAVYRKTFNSPALPKGRKLYLDLGNVQDIGIARVILNGKDLGIVWAPPFRVPVTGILKPKGNQLEVEIINSWRNRLVGDRDKPQGQRFTQTNITIRKEWELLPSGLLGPVQLLKAESSNAAFK